MKKEKKKELRYFNELSDENGFIYSVDKLRIEFYVDEMYQKKFFALFNSVNRVDITLKEKYNSFKYRYQWTIIYDEEAKMTVGYQFWGKDYQSDSRKGYIEVNPNKVGNYNQFWSDFREIKSCCKYFNVKRCDIALDMPIKREYLSLVKTNKKYELYAKSNSNRSEYLGPRSNIGFVKLYNKTAESNLDYDLSRLEITCLLSAESYKQHFPTVLDVSKSGVFSEDLIDLNDTERVIVELFYKLSRSGDTEAFLLFNSLGRRMKHKLKKYVMPGTNRIVYAEETINKLIENTQTLYLK